MRYQPSSSVSRTSCLQISPTLCPPSQLGAVVLGTNTILDMGLITWLCLYSASTAQELYRHPMSFLRAMSISLNSSVLIKHIPLPIVILYSLSPPPSLLSLSLHSAVWCTCAYRSSVSNHFSLASLFGSLSSLFSSCWKLCSLLCVESKSAFVVHNVTDNITLSHPPPSVCFPLFSLLLCVLWLYPLFVY